MKVIVDLLRRMAVALETQNALIQGAAETNEPAAVATVLTMQAQLHTVQLRAHMAASTVCAKAMEESGHLQ